MNSGTTIIYDLTEKFEKSRDAEGLAAFLSFLCIFADPMTVERRRKAISEASKRDLAEIALEYEDIFRNISDNVIKLMLDVGYIKESAKPGLN